MIVFNRISAKNFLSIGNSPISISLNTHALTLIHGSNGSGKSSIPEAIVFGLYGKPFRPFNKPQLVNSINQKQCLVEIAFSIGSKQYLIKRGIKPHVFEIYENDKLLNQDPSIKDYQKVLEQQILKMNYRAFTQVVVIGSSSFVPFMRLKTHERREFIEDLLDIRIFSVMNTLLRDNVKSLKDSLKDIDVEIRSLKEKVDLQESHIKSRKNEKKSYIDSLHNNVKKLHARCEKTQKEVSEHLNIINALTKDNKQYEDSVQTISELNSQHRRIKENIKKINREKELIHEVDSCPTCKQDILSQHKEYIAAAVEQQVTQLENEVVLLDNELRRVGISLIKFEEISSKIKQHNDEISKLNKSIFGDNNTIENIQSQIEDITSDTTNLDDETVKLKEYAKEVLYSITKKKELLDLQQYQNVAGVLLQDNGIKAKIIKQYIPIINKLINKYLDSMDLFVGFHLDENFNEIIKSRHRDSFTYESFSDGQKRRIDAALLLTWRDVAKSKNSVNTNIAFFDEVDSPLDGNGADMLIELYKASHIENVFLISHKEGLMNHADRVIQVEMKNSFTQIGDI